MAKNHEYICDGCKHPTRRAMLTVKKVLFTEMGAGGSTTRARVVAWLCPDCVKKDPDWNLPPRRQPSESPSPKMLDEEVFNG